MTLSAVGLALLKDLEGCRPLPYRDVAGLWSFGVGHLLTKSELSSGKIVFMTPWEVVQYGRDPWPALWIEALLQQDVVVIDRALARLVRVPLTQHQEDALLCWTFNVGVEALRTSTLRKKLNGKGYAEVPAEMRRWVHAGGQVIEGLGRRREREAALWQRT